MIKKFEIKSHDGPGRIGKIDGEKTPILFYENDLKICPSEGSAYNIDKEIAQFNVNETLRLARENVDTYDAAVIQGSKYIDLRIECMKELENIGYNIFIIANGDELLTNPRELVDIVVNLRKNAHPSTMLIFTFAESSFMPILTYMGIDGFLTDASNYYSHMNVLQTPTKAYDLNTYKIYKDITREELEKKNIECLEFVIREIQTHMENSSLRNLVEERSGTAPQNISTLKILDKTYMDFILEYSQLF
ncbi:MAG: archaeosine tRNA-ribosyltransferase [Methanobrevibacter sp.]|uniref:archaeosine tRNA-ribosyltransferase n=1 Tax=Methanobrevibacter sp. TaxID=66852 RepID=UPI0025D239E1|nr:archaeosine tRNA-ribosyltransferase [Methanobrevibacter sp.]MBR0272193.1 archaeosine tRNA-ribosyltransferase [Methanobrevibacter sp.]